MKRKEYAFVIPVYNPDKNLTRIVKNIAKHSDNRIFIIDDGSDIDCSFIYKELKEKTTNVNVIRHAVNLGKGAALKTIFNHVLINHPNIDGVVTLDGDGQHSVNDCLRVLQALGQNDNFFVLGYRTFNRNVPLKSYLGNRISNFIYKIILGKGFKDTQTGLRGLRKSFMKQCLAIKSNRFEFETEQLAMAVNRNIKIIEMPIQTIYIESNKASSFRPLIDSFKIYFILFRYGLSSIITVIVDFIIFMVALSFDANILVANMFARTASIGVQFTLLDKFVFYTKAKIINFILFVLYVYVMGIFSSMSQISAVENLNISIVSAKIAIEGLLFLVNFAVLRLYIFKKKVL